MTSDPALLDRAYATVMGHVLSEKAAPHYTELASLLDVPIAEAKDLTHELVALTPGWTHPGTDYLASFPPFNLQPTHYRVSIDGESGWYAEGRIEAPCLCCGEPIVVTMQDDDCSFDPGEVVGYSSAEIGGDAASRPFR